MNPKCYVAVLLVAIHLSDGFSQVQQEPSIADWEWFGKHRDRAFDVLMPMKEPAALVTYRSSDEFSIGQTEHFFLIQYQAAGGFDRNRLMASVLVPGGRTIQRQLLDAYMKDRSASFDTIVSQVVARRTAVEADTCPGLRDRMDALTNLVVVVPDRGKVTSHATSHRLVIELSSAFRMDLVSTDRGSALVTWGIETNRALLACAKVQL